jgi:hypothetical protein
MKHRLFQASTSLLLFILALTLGVSVNAQTPEKLRVAYTVIAPTQLNVWTAKDMGYYAKNGLDVDLVLLVGAPLAVAALVGGETPIVHTGASAVITSNLAGSGAVLIAGAINRFPYVRRRGLQRDRRQAHPARALSDGIGNTAFSRSIEAKESQGRPGQTERVYRSQFLEGARVERLHRPAVSLAPAPRCIE